MVKQLLLKKKVLIKGPDYFGRKAWISFEPTKPGLYIGWFWRTPEGDILPILPDIITHKPRRVALQSRDGKCSLEIIEHIMPLVFTGLCGVIISSSCWPPYHGRTLELWEHLQPHIEENGQVEMKWVTVNQECNYAFPDNSKRWTKISQRFEPGLKIKVISKYKGLGEKEIVFNFPNRGLLENVFSVHSQGWPPLTHSISKIVSSFGWPHHNKIVWPQDKDSDVTIRLFAYHRALDLLGSLATLCPPGRLIAANVESHCSGHKADVGAVQHFDPSELIHLY